VSTEATTFDPELTPGKGDQPHFKEAIANDGYAFVSEYCPGTDIAEIANGIGQPLTPWEGGLVQELVPRATATPNTYSGIYGLDSFPLHTDLAHWRVPPRYLLLRCVTGYKNVPTLLLDGQTILDVVTPEILTRAIFKPRRPQNGKIKLLRLYEFTDSSYCFRWDEIFINPASKIGEVARCLVREQLRRLELSSIALAHTGDTLLIDNWRMLHARSPIPAGCNRRKIQRIYLENLH
jgi:L-asparagine oxygenase